VPRGDAAPALQGSQASHDASDQMEGHQQIAAHPRCVSLVPGCGIGEQIDDQPASVVVVHVQKRDPAPGDTARDAFVVHHPIPARDGVAVAEGDRSDQRDRLVQRNHEREPGQAEVVRGSLEGRPAPSSSNGTAF
jgi:hypothetical protein